MKWTEEKINILKENISKGLTYFEIGEIIGFNKNSVRLKSQKLGLSSNYKDALKDLYENIECINCDKHFESLKSENRKFCSSNCSVSYNNKLRIRKVGSFVECKTCSKEILLEKSLNRIYCSRKCHRDFEYNERVEQWKSGLLSGCSGKAKSIRNWLRKYLFDSRGAKCQKCGWNECHPIDGKPLVEINHIDGNAENNNEDNLEILCPNCHSMTHNFRARNKVSTRIRK